MEAVEFAIVGGGWRAEFFLGVGQALPQLFTVSGIVVRDAARASLLRQKWGVRTYGTLDELVARAHSTFVVVSVAEPSAPGVIRELVARGMPVLAETPPAPDLEGLNELYHLTMRGARIQVAEQYAFQPLHAARIAVAQSGKLGVVSQAQVSVTQDYHAMSLIRKLLGIQFEDAVIRAQHFLSPVIAGPTRQGPPAEEKTVAVPQVIAQLDFGNKLAVYDYTNDQHRSWIRSSRVLVRGERGEIHDTRVRYLRDFATPITTDLLRQDAGQEGNLEGYFHTGILLGDEWVYRNPFAPARLNDDEIAVATCLTGMAAYVAGGPPVYDLAEAAQDHYLGLMVHRAVETGEPVRTTRQTWAR